VRDFLLSLTSKHFALTTRLTLFGSTVGASASHFLIRALTHVLARRDDCTASSFRVVSVKATSSRRAQRENTRKHIMRDLDAAERTRTQKCVAAPEIMASHGSPEIRCG